MPQHTALAYRPDVDAKSAGVGIIDPMDSLCNAESCPGALEDGTLMYKDGGHLRSSIVASHATFLDRIFEALQD